MRPSVHRAHAGQHRVLHRAAEVGLLHQRAWICSRRRMWRQAEQHPHRQHRQRHHHPEQRVADQADRGALAPPRSIRCRCRTGASGTSVSTICAGRLEPRHAGRRCWFVDVVARVQHRDHVAVRHLRRHEVAQQPRPSILGHQRAGEGRGPISGTCTWKTAAAVRMGRARIDRLAQLAR